MKIPRLRRLRDGMRANRIEARIWHEGWRHKYYSELCPVLAICAVWDDPPACAKYLADLLIDHRGGRKGFPSTVLRELNVLQA